MTGAARYPDKSLNPLGPLIVLIGNPNTGKTTLFNGLCRSNQKTGNYPGTTIEKKTGFCTLPSQGKARILDLPGLYSLQAKSPDTEITKKCLLGKLKEIDRPDLLLFTADAANLRRNFFLFTQLSELGIPAAAALTMQDQIEQAGITLNLSYLERQLGIPFAALASHKRDDIERLKTLLDKALGQRPVPRAFVSSSKEEENLFSEIHKKLNQKNFVSRWEARQILEQKRHSWQEWEMDSKKKMEADFQNYKQILEKNPALPALSRYSWIDKLLKNVIQKKKEQGFRNSRKWDAVLTHRFWGLCIFGVFLYFIFQSIYTWAEPAVAGVEAGLAYISSGLGPFLEGTPLLQSLVQDGILSGVGAVLVFLPQIAILFFFIALLEDSGYLVRAAFLTDRLFSWTGLNGRSFIPLLSSFACAIPGILSARVMPEYRARLSTILIAPLMSCSARLPIYLLFIGALIEPRYGAGAAALCLFLMHSIGPLLAMPISWLLNTGLKKGQPSTPFVMEFPPYRRPNALNVFLRVYGSAKKFTVKAGTIIFCFSILIWGLAYFPRNPQSISLRKNTESISSSSLREETETSESAVSSQLEYSLLGRMGKTIAPVFSPLGFDWKITVGILAAFPARELLISALGVMYNIEDTSSRSKDLRKHLQKERHPNGKPVYTPLTALSLMIFFALCSQCMGTIAVIKKELGAWKWPAFVFVYMTALAYICSFLTYQGGRLLGFE